MSEQNQERIRRKVESGLYASVDEVVENALALQDEYDAELEAELSDLRESLRRSAAQSEAGLGVPGKEVFDELRRRNAEMVRERRRAESE